MKKWIWYLVFILVLLIPGKVLAYDTDKFYIEAYINDDGSMTVKEIISFNQDSFDGTNFYTADIYNGSNLDINLIGALDKDLIGDEFPSNYEVSKIFEENYYASNGDSGVYTINYTSYGYGYSLRLYNPSSMNQAFYLEYTVDDVVVIHNDYAEVLWNFLGEWQESIKDFQITVHLPGSSDEIRVWSHGALNGENKIVNDS